MIQSGRYKRIIVIGADKMSSVVDYKDRSTCPLFGDGAAAVLVEGTTEQNIGAMDSYFRADGKGLPFLHLKAGGSVCPPSHFTSTTVCITSIRRDAQCSAMPLQA